MNNLITMRLKIFLFILTNIICYVALINAQEWKIQNSGIENNLNSVYFFDDNHGWATGDSGTIISTINGGEFWKLQISPIDTIDFIKVLFTSPNNGFIQGTKGFTLKTEDGGVNWLLLNNDFFMGDFYFFDNDKGWATSGNTILCTTNGGCAWDKQYEIEDLFHAISFSDSMNGWALAGFWMDNFDATDVYYTNNGGKSWWVVSTLYSPMWELKTITNDTIWVGGLGLAHSKNGGINWDYNKGNISGGIWDIEPVNGHSGWISTWKKLMYTEDCMNTWIDRTPTTKSLIRDFCIIGKDFLWAVGDSGLVIKYCCIPTSINQCDHGSYPQKIYLFQNYPNPFNPRTKIKYTLQKSDNVIMKIYDLTGQEIETLGNGFQSAGEHEITWHPEGLSSGIYFYRLQAKGFSETKKLVLQK